MLWTADVFYGSCLTGKDVVAEITIDPNGVITVKFEKYVSKPAKIKTITPYGVVEVGE